MEEDGDEEDLAAAIAMSVGGSGGAPVAAGGTAPAAPSTAPAASAAERAVADLRCANKPEALEGSGAVRVLTTLLSNVAKSPGEEKFRKVKLSNEKIARVIACRGAEELLASAGFQRSGDIMELSGDAETTSAGAGEALAALAAAFGGFVLSAQVRIEAEPRCICPLPASSGGFATGASDNRVRLHRNGMWETPVVLSGHESMKGVAGVLAVCPFGDSGAVASSGRDGKIIIWRDGAQSAVFSGHGEGIDITNAFSVGALAPRPGAGLLSGGWDKTAREWSAEGKQAAVMQGHTIAVNAVVALPDGAVATGSGDQSIGIWRQGVRLTSLAAGAPVRALCACGAFLASAGNDGTVRLWDAAAGKEVAQNNVAGDCVLSLAFRAESGGLLAAGAADGSLAVLRVEGSSLVRVETLQLCGEVYGLTFLESGDLVAACGDRSCVVWTRHPGRAANLALQQDFAARASALAAASAGSAGAGAQGPAPPGGDNWDFTFPVTLGGREMRLTWNRGEPPETVAARFLTANGLDPSQHTTDVIAFVKQAQAQAGSGGGGGGGGGGGVGASKDFSYPVEVGDGRRLTISWNRGDDPQTVALDFARQHGGIGADELPDIAAFVQQASGAPAPAAAPMMVQQAPPSAAPVSEAQQREAMLQLLGMGFEEGSARAALTASSWNVEAAVARLL